MADLKVTKIEPEGALISDGQPFEKQLAVRVDENGRPSGLGELSSDGDSAVVHGQLDLSELALHNIKTPDEFRRAIRGDSGGTSAGWTPQYGDNWSQVFKSDQNN